jgi:hypothetical protein
MEPLPSPTRPCPARSTPRSQPLSKARSCYERIRLSGSNEPGRRVRTGARLRCTPCPVIEMRQVGDGARCSQAPRRDPLLDRQRPFECLLRLVGPPLRLVKSRHGLERAGDPPVVGSGPLGLRECLPPMRLGFSRSLFVGRLLRRSFAGLPLRIAAGDAPSQQKQDPDAELCQQTIGDISVTLNKRIQRGTRPSNPGTNVLAAATCTALLGLLSLSTPSGHLSCTSRRIQPRVARSPSCIPREIRKRRTPRPGPISTVPRSSHGCVPDHARRRHP